MSFPLAWTITKDGKLVIDIAGDADTVDGFHASASPEANKLLALNASSKLPASITGDADTVDSIHAATTVTPNKLLAINATGRLPSSITGDAHTVDGYHAAIIPTASKLLPMNPDAKFPTHTIAGSLTVESGFNVGTATGAPAGHIYSKGAGSAVVVHDTTNYTNGQIAETLTAKIDVHQDGAFPTTAANRLGFRMLWSSTTESLIAAIEAHHGTGWGGGLVFLTKAADGNNAGPLYARMYINQVGNIYPGGNKTQDLGLSGTAWDDCWADDFQNEPDYYYMDSRRDISGKLVPVNDLAVIRGIKPSGKWDARTGLPLIDDASLPSWIFTRDKETGETLYGPDDKPWLSLKMTTSLSWGAIRQLDGYRLAADAEREAIRVRLDDMERRA